MVFVPSGGAHSNVNGRRRCLDRRLAGSRSRRPSAGVTKIRSPPQAATGFLPLADGGCERKQDSQRFQHRSGLMIFEPARPIGTKTVTD
jgi:hypothetical protein